MSHAAGLLNEKKGLRVVAGFLFTVFLIISLFSYHAYNLTSYNAVEKIGLAVASEVFGVQTLIEGFYPELIQLAEQNPDYELSLPDIGIDLDIKAGELKEVSRDEIGDYILSRLIKRAYDGGFSNVLNPEGLGGGFEAEVEKATSLADAFVSKRFNDAMLLTFYISIFFSFLFAILFFIFSPGFKKLTGFGTSFTLAGIPGLPLLLFPLFAGGQNLGVDSPSSLIQALLPFIERMQLTYLIVLLLGICLLLGGISGIFITRREVKKSSASS